MIHRRLVTASREIENYEKYDYILVNDRLEESIDALKSILLAERLKRARTEGQGERSADDTDLMAMQNAAGWTTCVSDCSRFWPRSRK